VARDSYYFEGPLRRSVVWEGDPISRSFPSATKALDAAEPMILRIIDRLIENGELRA
jgi:hypothetical protein